MTKRRRILHADKIVQNIHLFCLLMFLQIKGCYSEISSNVLLYSTATDIRMVNTSKLNKVNTIVKDLEQGSAVDFLYRKNLICWSDQTAELIECTYCNETHIGDKIRIVSDGIITPAGIAIDWYTEKIYWTDGETNRIEVISIQEKHRKVLFWSEVDLARAIAVVPKESLLFWSDWGEMPKIERAGMDGDPTTRKVIVKEDIFWPNGITIDYDRNILYWVDAQLHFLDAMDFNGDNRRRVVKTGLVYPYAITMISEKLYWTDWRTWAIHTWDMSSGAPKVKELLQSKQVPVDVKVFGAARQPLPARVPCRDDNGGCSHLCLLSRAEPGYTCACPTGVKLKEGSKSTCLGGPQSLLLIAQRASIARVSLDSADFTPYPVPLKDLKRAQSLDYDPTTDYIYWTDNLAKTISRARLDGSAQAVVVRGGAPECVALDALAGNLYWTDPAADTISVARHDGLHAKIIIYSDLYEPRALALHPARGLMFWTDWSAKRPRVERAALDGSERTVVASDRLAWPNGLALDTENDKVYWGDARTHKIEMSDLDGSNRKELQSSEILHIFGLALLGNYLYWTDMQKRTLDRINKDTGGERQSVVEQMANMMGVRAFAVGAELAHNRCSRDNGGCSHLCFNRPRDKICACPLGLELGADGMACAAPVAFLVYARKDSIGWLGLAADTHDRLPIRDLKEVSAVAVEGAAGAAGAVYWADTKARAICRSALGGARHERLVDGLGLVEGLAIDWSSQNMYWTDTATQRIEIARLDGSSRRALVCQGLKKPKSIVLDPKRGYMYWSELGSRSIKRAMMDGTAISVVVEGAGRVHALAIDADGRTLYWAALEPPVIASARTDGTDRRTLAEDLAMPYALAVHAGIIYWGDWNTGVVESMTVSGGSRSSRHTGLDYIAALAVGARAAGGDAACAAGGGCEHVCVPAGGAARCLCPAHYTLKPDNVSCAEPDDFLLIAQRNAVGRVVLAPGECADSVMPVTGLRALRAADYDPVDRQLYWIEEDSQSIKRVPVSSSTTSAITDSTVVVSDLYKPGYLVLDVVGRALYWTGSDSNSINVTSLLNTSISGVLVQGDDMKPRHIVFHQTLRILAWNDVGLGAIMRGGVDGGARGVVARAHNVTALALDHASAVLYWAQGRQIHAAPLTAAHTHRGVVWAGGGAGALGAWRGQVFAGGAERALVRVPAARRDAPAAPLPHVARVVAATAVHPAAVRDACWRGGACGAAACGAGGACVCGLRCGPARAACPAQHVRCGGSALCIPAHWQCDGQRDCADGADEAACGGCGGGVRCADGACAGALAACAGGARCSPATASAFRCDRALCLPAALLCDGTAHCQDQTDEAPALCRTQPQTERAEGGSGAAVWGGLGGAAAALAAAGVLLRRWRRRPRRAPPQHLPLQPTKYIPPAPTESSSATDSGRYPRPTANPPPSPATVSSGAGAAAGAGAGGRRRGYRHYRAINRPPPPTPASTDACESEPEARAPPPSPAHTH